MKSPVVIEARSSERAGLMDQFSGTPYANQDPMTTRSAELRATGAHDRNRSRGKPKSHSEMDDSS